jgi:tRNA A22 N-methylase
MAMARSEIKILLNRNICRPAEREFFENVLHAQHNNDDLRSQLVQHVYQIEHEYHKNQQGQFVQLWPEIERLIK